MAPTNTRYTWTYKDLQNAIEKGQKTKFCSQPDYGYASAYNRGVDAAFDALTPARIIYNPPATIVFWNNGDKTVVKCAEKEEFNKYHGFCAALAKQIFDSNSAVNRIVNSGIEETPVKVKKSNTNNKKSKKGSNKK